MSPFLLGLVIGLFVGAIVGLVTMAMLVAARQADDRMRFVHQAQDKPTSHPWDDPSSDPLGDLRETARRMREDE